MAAPTPSDRDLIGYGRVPPPVEWPDGARVVVNVVLVYEEGSEYSVLSGDERNDGWGEYADAGVQPPQRDLGTETHYDYGARAGIWRLARIVDEAGVPATVSATAVALELNPPVAEWMRERDHDLLGHGRRWTELWTLSRDEERAELRRMMTVAVHARWSGQPARAAALRRFLEHALAREGVRFMRRDEIARWWLERYPPR